MATVNVRKFWLLPWRDRWLMLESWLLQLVTGLLLKVIPFRWIPRVFSSRQFEAPTQEEAQSRSLMLRHRRSINPVHAVSGLQSTEMELIKTAIQRAGTVSPWKNKCLVSSLAGRCMLRRRKIESQLSLGVAKDAAGKTVAHAWLKSGDFEIVEKSGDYTELYIF